MSTLPAQFREGCTVKGLLSSNLAPSGMRSSGEVMRGAGNDESSYAGEVTVLIAHSDPVVSAGIVAVLRAFRDFKVIVLGPAETVSELSADRVSSADVDTKPGRRDERAAPAMAYNRVEFP